MCPTGTAHLPDVPERSDFRPAFDVLDMDRDGKISCDDLRAFYSGFCGGGAASEKEEEVIGSMMTVADGNKDGYVEYEEFERVLKRRERNVRRGVMEEAFRVMDRDGDGRVGHDDLKSYLKWAGFNAGDEDIVAMIKLGGGDQKHGVTFDGLLKILAI